MPPGWDESYLTCFGYTFDKIGPEGVNSLTDQAALRRDCPPRRCPAPR